MLNWQTQIITIAIVFILIIHNIYTYGSDLIEYGSVTAYNIGSKTLEFEDGKYIDIYVDKDLNYRMIYGDHVNEDNFGHSYCLQIYGKFYTFNNDSKSLILSHFCLVGFRARTYDNGLSGVKYDEYTIARDSVDWDNYDYTTEYTFKNDSMELSTNNNELVNQYLREGIKAMINLYADYGCDLTNEEKQPTDSTIFRKLKNNKTGVISCDGYKIVKNWIFDDSYTGFAEFQGKWIYFENGRWSKKSEQLVEGTISGKKATWYIGQNAMAEIGYTGIKQIGLEIYYVREGQVDIENDELIYINENGYNYKDWIFFEKGRANFDKHGICKCKYDGKNGYYLVKKGRLLKDDCFSKDSNGSWWYCKGGNARCGLTGLEWGTVNGKAGYWYIESGRVDFNKSGVIEVDFVGSKEAWYVKDGFVSGDYVGFIYDSGDWWYCYNNIVVTSKKGIVKGVINGKDACWYVIDGKVDYKYSGFVSYSSNWWYVVDGKIDNSIDGVIKGVVEDQNGWWFCEKGKVNFSKNDIVKGAVSGQNGWWYVSGGKVQFVDSVEKNSNGWWCVQKGKVNFNYTGFAKNSNGWWYCEKGKVNFNKKDVIKGTVNGQSGWWYVSGGKVQFADSVEKNSNGWWAIRNGKVDFNYTGFAKNSNGWWYCEKGKVNFNKKDVIKGTVNGQPGWWYVSGGKVQFVNSVEKNSNGWWCIQNGKVNFNYTGFAKNSNGWWYCEKGKVNFNKKDVIKGTVNGQSGWWYVSGGKVQFTDTVEKNSNGWWSIKNGKVDFSFTGIAKNSNGQWYCKGGKVQFSYSGTITYNGKKYNIKNGKVQ